MESKKTDVNELAAKVLDGMKAAMKKLVETKAKNDQDLVIGDQDGNITIVPAIDLLNTV